MQLKLNDPKPDGLSVADPELREDVAKDVWDQTIGPVLYDESNDEFWAKQQRWEALRERTENRLYEKDVMDVQQRLSKAVMDFMSEQVSLGETQAAMCILLDLAEDEALRAEYADFVDAPLGTVEEQTVARAAFCGILGIASTFKLKKNHKEIGQTLERVVKTAGDHWRNQREQLTKFLARFLALTEDHEEESKRTGLRVMAAGEEALMSALAEHWQELDKHF